MLEPYQDHRPKNLRREPLFSQSTSNAIRLLDELSERDWDLLDFLGVEREFVDRYKYENSRLSTLQRADIDEFLEESLHTPVSLGAYKALRNLVWELNNNPDDRVVVDSQPFLKSLVIALTTLYDYFLIYNMVVRCAPSA